MGSVPSYCSFVMTMAQWPHVGQRNSGNAGALVPLSVSSKRAEPSVTEVGMLVEPSYEAHGHGDGHGPDVIDGDGKGVARQDDDGRGQIERRFKRADHAARAGGRVNRIVVAARGDARVGHGPGREPPR